MTFDELIAQWGTVGNIAAALGASSQAVSDWRITGIPEGRQYQVELATGRRLRADLPALRAIFTRRGGRVVLRRPATERHFLSVSAEPAPGGRALSGGIVDEVA